MGGKYTPCLYAEVNGKKTKSPLQGGERGIEGKKKTRQEFALLKQNGLSKAESAEILRPLTSARNYATIADRKSKLRRGKYGRKTVFQSSDTVLLL